MNFTLALLAGLVLLLPGMTALVSWNIQGAAQGAKRPELQLTSVTALFVALGMALLMHVLGYGLVSLIWAALVELGEHVRPVGPLIENPYEMALAISLGGKPASSGSIEAFLVLTLLECLLAWRLIASPGLDLVLDGFDVRSQGWVYQHVVRPLRHGYTPIAYVLTTTPSGEYGIGYEGIVADIRQGENGELKSISLAEPQRFAYQLIPASDQHPRRKPQLVTHEREWVGGVVALDGSVVRNVVIHSVSQALVEELEELAVGEGEDPSEWGLADRGQGEDRP
ncbi:hypothetical protein [Novosphingobium sp. SG916]|uniref:hypothetical protein n=2 Tax=unclassified Novosphingobium TaxID=2644732 RepID=UPI00146A010B|nr:hypothetical protein [Novosphingobium sp. SG916]NMN03876.1 hypothetical protein [Novosphingobium sp. SG919]NMN86134.1 hypothetical protein [Novosphingobium sp. SG916]